MAHQRLGAQVAKNQQLTPRFLSRVILSHLCQSDTFDLRFAFTCVNTVVNTLASHLSRLARFPQLRRWVY
jgi:hypothetical protein